MLLSSLVQHLLGRLLELAAPLVYELLLFLSEGRNCPSVCTVCRRHSTVRHRLSVEGLRIVTKPVILSFHCGVPLVHSWASSVGHIRWLNHGGLTARNPYLGIPGCKHCCRFLPNYIHNRVFECLFVLAQSVLFPGVIHELLIIMVSVHARLKHIDHRLVIWLLFELQCTTVIHKFTELVRLPAA